jgi:hypothetical protein
MNAHQRRKQRREKEREAMKYSAEIEMIPNPTLKKEFHPHYDGHIKKALETLPTDRIVSKKQTVWQYFLAKLRSLFHAPKK